MKKRSILLLAAEIIATAYLIYIVSYFFKDSNEASDALASVLVFPHIIVLLFGVIFGWIGYFTRVTGFSLAAAILYCVSAALFILYAMFLILPIIFEFVGYSNQKKINAAQ